LSDDPLAAFYLVALAVGTRPSEALALSWDDINLERGK
jgi:integrase